VNAMRDLLEARRKLAHMEARIEGYRTKAKEAAIDVCEMRKSAIPLLVMMRKVRKCDDVMTKLLEKYKQKALGSTAGVRPNNSTVFKKYEEFSKLSTCILEIQNEITTIDGKIRCLGNNDNGRELMREYAEREAVIDNLKHEISRKKGSNADYWKNIQRIKEQWIPQISELVESINDKFSTFFRGMNCAGEVSLRKGTNEDDFEAYGIVIKVKFRSDSPLVELSSQTQSGGERAVTTAIYLMALQELTSVPFRCVDEINQGMDAENERRTFTLLTSILDGPNCPQYFLLTPKVLPQLDYASNMKMVFPFNGIGVPGMHYSQTE